MALTTFSGHRKNVPRTIVQSYQGAASDAPFALAELAGYAALTRPTADSALGYMTVDPHTQKALYRTV